MIAVWLLLVGMISLPFNLCAHKVSAQIDSLIKGMTVNAWSAEAYNSSDFDESITNLAGIGADWALFTIFWFMETKYDNEMHQRLDLYSASDSSLIHAIQKTQELGMKVALKPMIDVVDGTWRAQISPSNWTLWFENYRDFINHYAVVAETNGVELFVVGCELSSSQSYESEWRQVISELKSQFSKETTYAADWNSYSTSDVAFWDALDYVGVDAWFPLTNSYTPSVSQLISAWSYCTRSGYVGRDWVNELFSAYASTGKKVLFTEVGYCSKDGTNRHPYNYWYNSSVDFQEQADCYEAALEVFKDESWFEGWFWWNWETDPDAGLPGTPDEDHYTPQNKPAEDILYLYYSQPPPDIAITMVTPDSAVVDKGSSVNIDVTAQNQGNFTETFNVTAYANNTAIQTKALTLASGDSITTTLTWNTATTDLGDYRITAQAHPLPNETDTADNNYTDGVITVIEPWHDVEVFDVSFQSPIVAQGKTTTVYVGFYNPGRFTETFNVTAYANTTIIGMQELTNVTPGYIDWLTIYWNTAGAPLGDYTLSAYATPVVNETITANNNCTNGVVTVRAAIFDVAVTDVVPEAASAGAHVQGDTVSIDVWVQNQGDFPETFNVTVVANMTTVETQTTAVLNGYSKKLTFHWDTTSFVPGNYTLSANATVLPGETDVGDNLYTDGWMSVILLGDVNGDGSVDIFDAIVVAGSFGSAPGDLNWNPDADLNGDYIIDIFDAIIVAANFGK